MDSTKYYAAVDCGVLDGSAGSGAVYGIGTSPEDAVADARQWSGAPDAFYTVVPCDETAAALIREISGAPSPWLVVTRTGVSVDPEKIPEVGQRVLRDAGRSEGVRLADSEARKHGRADANTFLQEHPRSDWEQAVKPGQLGPDEALINGLGSEKVAKLFGVPAREANGTVSDAFHEACRDYNKAWLASVREAMDLPESETAYEALEEALQEAEETEDTERAG